MALNPEKLVDLKCQKAATDLGPSPPRKLPDPKCLAMSRYLLLPQQRQHTLWQLVGLRHHGGTSLLQHLRTRQVGGFRRKVGVLDPAARGGQIFRGRLQTGYHRGEPVLIGTERGARSTDRLQSADRKSTR